eukprot:4522204-Prymnesium_polylepis.1
MNANLEHESHVLHTSAPPCRLRRAKTRRLSQPPKRKAPTPSSAAGGGGAPWCRTAVEWSP